jgi:hypothetical protein
MQLQQRQQQRRQQIKKKLQKPRLKKNNLLALVSFPYLVVQNHQLQKPFQNTPDKPLRRPLIFIKV